MRHSIAVHNEAASMVPDAMASVYLNEAFADSSLSHAGYSFVRRARQALVGLSPPPDVVFCSPLTRAIQTAVIMFEGTGIPIVALPEVREAYGRFPCDRHKDKRDLEAKFGDAVDFRLCTDKDTLWTADCREDMSHLSKRVAAFLDGVLRREEGHVFVVSHGVFMETAVRHITAAYPQYHTNNRVHNCEVHTFVFSLPSSPAPSSRAREGDGYSLTEAPFYGMLARSGLSEQEMKWIFSALDREGYGKVPAWDFLLALMAFYPGQPARAAAAMTAGGTNEQQVGLREFRMRYQRQLYGTPLSSSDVLGATFERILSEVLAMP
ncbi:unnamed protein product [Ascophyllum nodosum]